MYIRARMLNAFPRRARPRVRPAQMALRSPAAKNRGRKIRRGGQMPRGDATLYRCLADAGNYAFTAGRRVRRRLRETRADKPSLGKHSATSSHLLQCFDERPGDIFVCCVHSDLCNLARAASPPFPGAIAFNAARAIFFSRAVRHKAERSKLDCASNVNCGRFVKVAP